MKSIANYDFKGKKALIRVDFNIPLDSSNQITDDTRMVSSLPTMNRILEGGGSVILMSHLGRPKGGYEDKYSLKHLISHLSKLLGKPVLFAPDCIGAEARELASSLKPGAVLMLENLRFYKEEEEGNRVFAGKLAALGDVYVNDAFATAHRAHASTTIVADFFEEEKMFGFLIESELKSLDFVMVNTKKPYTAIVGGAKVSTKITILENLIKKVDNLIIGGGMAFTFIKAMGGKVGDSLVEEDKMYLSFKIFELADKNNVKLFLPVDAIVADRFDNEANTDAMLINKISEGWMGLDLGPESVEKFCEVIEGSKTILWNGPMGVFEMPKFETGTREVAHAVVKATQNGAYSLIGGGDTVAAINKYHLADKVSYVSTAGGALLEYLEGTVLPGIAAIRGK